MMLLLANAGACLLVLVCVCVLGVVCWFVSVFCVCELVLLCRLCLSLFVGWLVRWGCYWVIVFLIDMFFFRVFCCVF